MALVDARPPPTVTPSPDGSAILLGSQPALPTLAAVARPFAPLAGIRVDTERGSRRRLRTLDGLAVLDTTSGREITIASPGSAEIASGAWAPDGNSVAYLVLERDGVTLWTAQRDGSDAQARTRVLDLLAPAFRPRPGNAGWVVIVPQADAPPPAAPAVPSGPVIVDARGEQAQNRTWQDLLRSAHDEDRFEHYATGRVALLGPSGAAEPIGAPGIFDDVQPSPDGAYLLVERVRRPFSYAVPVERFARTLEVWNLRGEVIATLDDQEAAETIPIEGVRVGPRMVTWSPTDPSTLIWVAAGDGGDPRAPAEVRDRIFSLAAPFTAAPTERAALGERITSVDMLGDGARALVTEYDRDRRWVTTWIIDLRGGPAPRKLFDRSARDDYADPGRPVHTMLPTGHRAVLVDEGTIFLAGEGATPEGDRPFVDRLDLATGGAERLLRSPAGAHVELVALAGSAGARRLVVRRESPSEPPNLHVVSGDRWQPLTTWPDPYPQLRDVTRKLLKYRRDDGVELSGTLYLPAGARPGSKLPLVIWAYPLEYVDKDTAGQVRAAPNRYVRPAPSSMLPLLLRGFAVLDDAAMPVVGHPETMNDTLLDQLSSAARAAIDAAAQDDLIDRERVAIGGHSYGAFMTANLLAHTDLFRAGIARSGAYNRTLTPFGYQSERRTLWQAPATYAAVSPLQTADRIDEPILLVHGELDDNPGTFSLQSERLFQAIRGNGGTARLLVLPKEAHGYVARESVLHLLAEEIEWLEQYVVPHDRERRAARPSARGG